MKLSKILSILMTAIFIFSSVSTAQAEDEVIKYIGSALIIGSLAYPVIQGESGSTRDLFGTPLIACAAGVTTGWLLLRVAKNKSNPKAEMISLNRYLGITPVISPRFYALSLSIGF